jgi:hypothetical protein
MKEWMRDWGGATVVHAHVKNDQHDRPLVPEPYIGNVGRAWEYIEDVMFDGDTELMEDNLL